MVNTTHFPRTLGLELGTGSQMRALGHFIKITLPLDNFRNKKKVKNVKIKNKSQTLLSKKKYSFPYRY